MAMMPTFFRSTYSGNSNLLDKCRGGGGGGQCSEHKDSTWTKQTYRTKHTSDIFLHTHY